MGNTLLILAGLAVWRVTHMLHAEAGPGQIFDRWRAAAGAGIVGQALACFYCLSLWVAAPLALWITEPWAERVLLWLALSAAAILLERVTARLGGYAAASYHEEPLPADLGDAPAQQQLFP
jgi:hypothetical protein